MMKQTGLIGILGGLGPEAGRLLHGYIIEEAARLKSITCDQDHYDIVHLSLPSIIPDRASYIFDRACPNPTPVIFTILKSMALVAEQHDRPMSVCIPCNTYHAPVLFDPLKEALAKSDMRHHVRILNLIEESALAVQTYAETSKTKTGTGADRVGLISTSGERASGIYRHYLGLQGIEVIQADDTEQKFVDDAIYNPVYGLKATSAGTPVVREILRDVVTLLQKRGAEIIILGCTELPFVFDGEEWGGAHFISPMRIMARRLIEEAEKRRNIAL
jgi:aspartate racemase